MKRRSADAGIDIYFAEGLTVPNVPDLASPDMRVYIDHAPGGGRTGNHLRHRLGRAAAPARS